jgi:hypothetical protein
MTKTFLSCRRDCLGIKTDDNVNFEELDNEDVIASEFESVLEEIEEEGTNLSQR